MVVSYRAVLRLHDKKLKVTQIATQLGTTPKTVKRIIDKAEAKDFVNGKWEAYKDDALRRLLNPREASRKDVYEPDWKDIHDDLSRRNTQSSARNHLTLQFCYEEYVREANVHGELPMSRTSFYEQYRTWWQKNEYSSHLHWLPGRRMEIDFAGDVLYYLDPAQDNKRVTVVLFVCTLSYSKLTYVEAIPNQKMKHFMNGIIHACRYFGATASLWVPDCTRAAVVKGSKTDWAVLNATMMDLSSIYHVETVPCSPYTPKGVNGKAAVEGSVNCSYQRIYNRIRNITFYSLEEMNEALAGCLEEYNNEAFTDKPEWSRRKAYEEKERAFMQPLPSDDFELRQTTTAKVGRNYVYCNLDRFYYSIPHDLKEEQVIIKLGMNDVLITTIGNELIAKHRRGTDLWDRYVTIPEHLESWGRVYEAENPDWFIKQAEEKAGYGTRLVIENIFKTTQYPETVYKNCRAVLGLGRKYGYSNLEKACTMALDRYGSSPSARIGYSKLKPLAIHCQKLAQEEKVREMFFVPPSSKAINMDEFEV